MANIRTEGRNAALQARRNHAVPRGVGNLLSVFTHRATNAELWDEEGRRYIDFASGIAVLATGHRHPKVVAAVHKQLDAFTHTCFQVSPYESYVQLAERLNEIAPCPKPNKTIFLTTGAEAVENAVKIARVATGRAGIVAFSGAFHGRTMMGMALTGKVSPYKTSFAPLPSEVYHVPFPDPYRGLSVQRSLEALDTLFKADIDPNRVAAIIVEPVQGEGGFNVAPVELLQALRQVCDRYGILLIVDEIQTGFGRTGTLFATEHFGVQADLVTMAKSLAGGLPLSAVTGRAEIMDAVPPGGLGGTYAGSPLACVAALAVLDVIEEEHLTARAKGIGEQIKKRLAPLCGEYPFIGNVRGLGAMVAVELVKEQAGKEPSGEIAKAILSAAAQRGLILLTCGSYGQVIRFLPPLTVSDEVLNEGLDIFVDVVRSLK